MAREKESAGKAETFPRRSEKILWRVVDGDAVLFHEENGRAFALNEAAAAVWELCDGSRSIAELSDRYAGIAGMEGSKARDAASAVIERLAGEGCMEFVDSLDALPGRANADGPLPESSISESEPTVEEIVFAGCDCTGSGRGVMRNAECVEVSLKVQTSSV